MPGGNKSSVYLKAAGLFKYLLLLPPDIKELIAYIGVSNCPNFKQNRSKVTVKDIFFSKAVGFY